MAREGAGRKRRKMKHFRVHHTGCPWHLSLFMSSVFCRSLSGVLIPGRSNRFGESSWKILSLAIEQRFNLRDSGTIWGYPKLLGADDLLFSSCILWMSQTSWLSITLFCHRCQWSHCHVLHTPPVIASGSCTGHFPQIDYCLVWWRVPGLYIFPYTLLGAYLLHEVCNRDFFSADYAVCFRKHFGAPSERVSVSESETPTLNCIGECEAIITLVNTNNNNDNNNQVS